MPDLPICDVFERERGGGGRERETLSWLLFNGHI